MTGKAGSRCMTVSHIASPVRKHPETNTVLNSQSCSIQPDPLKWCCPNHTVFPPQKLPQTDLCIQIKSLMHPRSRGGGLGHASPGVTKNLGTHSVTTTTPQLLCAFGFSYIAQSYVWGSWQSGDGTGQFFTAVTTYRKESQINSCGLVLEMGDVLESPRSFLATVSQGVSCSSFQLCREVRKSLRTESLVPGNSQGNFHCIWGPLPSLGERRLQMRQMMQAGSDFP